MTTISNEMYDEPEITFIGRAGGSNFPFWVPCDSDPDGNGTVIYAPNMKAAIDAYISAGNGSPWLIRMMSDNE